MALTHVSMWFRSGLPEHCEPTTPFLRQVSVYFGTCMPTPLGFVSTLFGCISVLSWLCSQMPQIYKNFKLKSTAGLSFFFLIEWSMGDLTNLIGAALTGQATWQVVLASYYVSVDICLILQHIWYTYVLPQWREESIYSNGSDDGNDAGSDMINSLSPINSSFADIQTEQSKHNDEEPSESYSSQSTYTTRLVNTNHEKEILNPASSDTDTIDTGLAQWPRPSSRSIMYAATVSTLATRVAALPVNSGNEAVGLYAGINTETIGTVVAWCSTFLYIASRLPQLYHNWRRQSTTGLSPYLFGAAFSGNLFYSSSLLTNPSAWYNFGPYGGHGWVDEHGSRRTQWMVNAAPFFLGAFLVLFMDATMGFQFLLYGEEQEKVVKVRDRHGFSRWERVSGWMRGWIPSIKKEKIVDLAESQRLLSESRELDRHVHHSQYGGI